MIELHVAAAHRLHRRFHLKLLHLGQQVFLVVSQLGATVLKQRPESCCGRPQLDLQLHPGVSAGVTALLADAVFFVGNHLLQHSRAVVDLVQNGRDYVQPVHHPLPARAKRQNPATLIGNVEQTVQGHAGGAQTGEAAGQAFNGLAAAGGAEGRVKHRILFHQGAAGVGQVQHHGGGGGVGKGGSRSRRGTGHENGQRAWRRGVGLGTGTEGAGRTAERALHQLAVAGAQKGGVAVHVAVGAQRLGREELAGLGVEALRQVVQAVVQHTPCRVLDAAQLLHQRGRLKARLQRSNHALHGALDVADDVALGARRRQHACAARAKGLRLQHQMQVAQSLAQAGNELGQPPAEGDGGHRRQEILVLGQEGRDGVVVVVRHQRRALALLHVGHQLVPQVVAVS
eukprot:m.113635 g.113635  ORF g.113635 m.113635 type:complete len:399 (-) comp19322_c0_seq2:1469-2665(-)